MIKPLYRIYLPDIDQVSSSPAIAGYGEVAGLGVQGEHGQVHGAPQGQGHLHKQVNSYLLYYLVLLINYVIQVGETGLWNFIGRYVTF